LQRLDRGSVEVMDVEPGFNEGSNNVADAEAKRCRAYRTETGTLASSNPSSAGIDLKPFGEDGLTFGYILDIINPLQHIPVISIIYRSLTGDALSSAARIAGGALFGGPIEFISSVANTAVLVFSGKDIGENIAAAFGIGQPISLPPNRSPSGAGVTRVSSAAPYLSPHLTRSTQAIGNGTESLPRTAAGAKKVRPVAPVLVDPVPADPVNVQSNIPSSLLAMANSNSGGRSDAPIAALLQARATVPSRGHVPGFGAIVSSRVRPAADGVAAVSPANLLHAQNLGLKGAQSPHKTA
jgi:hypothetical protein